MNFLEIGRSMLSLVTWQASKGILDEMLRSSNERYDVEDSGQP